MYPALQYTKSIFALSCPKVLVLRPGVMFPVGHIQVVWVPQTAAPQSSYLDWVLARCSVFRQQQQSMRKSY